MKGICAFGQALTCTPALKILLKAVLLFGSPSLFSMHLYATSVVALIDHANQRLVIAADCLVSGVLPGLRLQNHSGAWLHGSDGGPLRGNDDTLSSAGICSCGLPGTGRPSSESCCICSDGAMAL